MLRHQCTQWRIPNHAVSSLDSSSASQAPLWTPPASIPPAPPSTTASSCDGSSTCGMPGGSSGSLADGQGAAAGADCAAHAIWCSSSEATAAGLNGHAACLSMIQETVTAAEMSSGAEPRRAAQRRDAAELFDQIGVREAARGDACNHVSFQPSWPEERDACELLPFRPVVAGSFSQSPPPELFWPPEAEWQPPETEWSLSLGHAACGISPPVSAEDVGRDTSIPDTMGLSAVEVQTALDELEAEHVVAKAAGLERHGDRQHLADSQLPSVDFMDTLPQLNASAVSSTRCPLSLCVIPADENGARPHDENGARPHGPSSVAECSAPSSPSSCECRSGTCVSAGQIAGGILGRKLPQDRCQRLEAQGPRAGGFTSSTNDSAPVCSALPPAPKSRGSYKGRSVDEALWDGAEASGWKRNPSRHGAWLSPQGSRFDSAKAAKAVRNQERTGIIDEALWDGAEGSGWRQHSSRHNAWVSPDGKYVESAMAAKRQRHTSSFVRGSATSPVLEET